MSQVIHKLQKQHSISHYKLKPSERKLVGQLVKDDEMIHGICRGSFVGGSGVLFATNKRLLLIDSKTMSNFVRALSYDRISHVNHSVRRFETMLFMNVDQYRFVFRSFNKDALRKITAHIMYNLEPAKHEPIDYLSMVKDNDLDTAQHTFVPRHRHGKFSIMAQ